MFLLPTLLPAWPPARKAASAWSTSITAPAPGAVGHPQPEEAPHPAPARSSLQDEPRPWEQGAYSGVWGLI